MAQIQPADPPPAPASISSSAAPAPPAPAGPGLTTSVTRQAGLEGRVMWMDGSANLQRLSTAAGVDAVFEKCRAANINTVVVDVKPLSGHVLYNSKIAPHLKEWKGATYPADYDLLANALLAGHRRGIRVYAAINVFCEAHKLLKSGPLYEHPEPQAIVYDTQRTVTAPDGASFTLAVGVNRPPADGQIVVYDGDGDSRALRPDEAAAVVTGTSVTGIVDGSLTDLGVLPVPSEGHLLIGRGAGARWLLEHLQVGQALKYSATPVLQPILDAPSEVVGGFVNPANPASRAYETSIVAEIADNYAVDGIVFDRMRYSSIRTDFSPLSRQLFEEWLAKRNGPKLERFPEDIYTYDPVPGHALVPGPLFKLWLQWRSETITSWLEEARAAALKKRSTLSFSVYVGSWYPRYYGVGVNWGADDYAPGYDWMTPEYPKTGYAGLLSWVSTGCYYGVCTREDARQLGVPEEETVEAAAETSVRAVNDAAFVYAGVYALDYRGRPDEFRKAVETALAKSQGVMLFDLSYIDEYNWWNILTDLFASPRRAPHDVPGLQEAIRKTRKALSFAAPAPSPAQHAAGL